LPQCIKASPSRTERAESRCQVTGNFMPRLVIGLYILLLVKVLIFVTTHGTTAAALAGA
jgi:hypothetical protein